METHVVFTSSIVRQEKGVRPSRPLPTSASKWACRFHPPYRWPKPMMWRLPAYKCQRRSTGPWLVMGFSDITATLWPTRTVRNSCPFWPPWRKVSTRFVVPTAKKEMTVWKSRECWAVNKQQPCTAVSCSAMHRPCTLDRGLLQRTTLPVNVFLFGCHLVWGFGFSVCLVFFN